MRKIFHVLSFIVLSSLLTACISIPFGDKTLEISTDGINIISNDENDVDKGGMSAENDGVIETDEQNDNDENAAEENNQTNDAQASTGNCGDQDYSPIIDDLDQGFFIPDCAILTNVEKNESTLYAYFEIEGGNTQEFFKAYKEYFGEKLNSENQNISSGTYEISANDGNTLIRLEQYEDYAYLRVIQHSQANE